MFTSRKLVASFALFAFLGAICLALPASWNGSGHCSWIDSLFTATSAVCVTGLTVVDTGKDFSPFGQVVVLLLIQGGGLGIITFSNFLLLAMGRKLGLGARAIVSETHGDVADASPGRLVFWAILFTLAAEALGAAALFFAFRGLGDAAHVAWLATFHSVSAFCNAGFSLFGPSLAEYRNNVWVNMTIMCLIVAGGLGFVVFHDIFSVYGPSKYRRGTRRRRLSLHSRIVLRTTLGLIVVGAAAIWIFELGNTFAGAPWYEDVLPSLFLSVTTRTAGFNTVDTSQLTNVTLLIVIVLMFIGASPGSTGGGIKTTTFAVLWASFQSQLNNRPDTEFLNRRVSSDTVAKAMTTTVGFALVAFAGVALLQITEYAGQSPGATRGWALEYLFETVSALGTVGLSTGVTSKLTTLGKLVLIACMFVGRLGPLVVAVSFLGRRERLPYSLPEERVMIG